MEITLVIVAGVVLVTLIGVGGDLLAKRAQPASEKMQEIERRIQKLEEDVRVINRIMDTKTS